MCPIQYTAVPVFPAGMRHQLPDDWKVSDVGDRRHNDASRRQQIPSITQCHFGVEHVLEHIVEKNAVEGPCGQISLRTEHALNDPVEFGHRSRGSGFHWLHSPDFNPSGSL